MLRLSDVRGFARYVANFDPSPEVPPVGMLPGWKRAKPDVYSDAEIDALLTAALALPPEGGLRRWTLPYRVRADRGDGHAHIRGDGPGA